MILGFSDYQAQGQRLAMALGRPFQLIEVHRFPDGESRVTVPSPLPEQVVLCRSLDRPDHKLVELLLAAETCRELGATQLTLVAPYLCYMRQDIAFHPGEAVSQRIIGRFLAGLFDGVLTVDPHLHRIQRLEQAIPSGQALALTAAPLMTRFLQDRGGEPLLLGPDGESAQWVRAIAEPAGLDYAVASKERLGDRQVRIHLPEGDYRGREVVLVDDMASTGRTLIGVAEQLKAQGAGALHCLLTHALFDAKTDAQLRAAGFEHLWSSDSVGHPSNLIELAPLLAEALAELP